MGGRDPESENGDPEKYFGPLTQDHSKRLDEAFESITHFCQLTNTPSAVLSNLIKLTPAGATKLLGRNSLSSYGECGVRLVPN